MNQIFPNFQIIRVPQTDSTNAHLLQLSNEKDLAKGTVVVTGHQTQGRGHGGNAWESEPGANLTFSVILYPFPSVHAFVLSKAISLAVYDFVSLFVSDVSVKWPNDVYVGEQKIAGILIENFFEGTWLTKSIAGIGLNINQEQFFSDAPNPVSLRQLTGKTYLLENCLHDLLAHIAARYKMITEDAAKLSVDYLQCLYRFGRLSRFSAGGILFDAIITGVNDDGMLEITTDNEERKTFGFKEVVFI